MPLAPFEALPALGARSSRRTPPPHSGNPPAYKHLPDFVRLVERLTPRGAFRNAIELKARVLGWTSKDRPANFFGASTGMIGNTITAGGEIKRGY